MRDVIEQSNVYSDKIHDAVIDAPNNGVSYEANTFAQQLKIVARLINGGLPTNIYILSLPGFDTHIQQLTAHQQLWSTISRGVKAFLDDVAASGHGDRVVCMTYSEFGRRVNENGSAGTDHGAAAPQMVMGRPVKGAQVLGGVTNLTDLDLRGDVKFSVDFRQIYASVLQDWLGFAHADTDTILGGSFSRLPLFDNPSGVRDENRAGMAGYALEQIAPNPVRTEATIAFAVPAAARVRLSVTASDGREVATLIDRTVDAGAHRVRFDARALPSGTYLYRLEAGGYQITRRMSVVR